MFVTNTVLQNIYIYVHLNDQIGYEYCILLFLIENQIFIDFSIDLEISGGSSFHFHILCDKC